jgi:hypothetical protein
MPTAVPRLSDIEAEEQAAMAKPMINKLTQHMFMRNLQPSSS